MVHCVTFGDDYYDSMKRISDGAPASQKIQLGDPVTVGVDRANLRRADFDFAS